MREERLMILSLLNEGKITANEAAELLGALGKAGGSGHKKQKHHGYDYGEYEYDGVDIDEKLKKFSQAVDNFSREFGGKVSDTFKEIEPKFKKTAKTVMEKTAAVVDDLAKALNESAKNMEEKIRAASEGECCCEDENCCDDEHKPHEN